MTPLSKAPMFHPGPPAKGGFFASEIKGTKTMKRILTTLIFASTLLAQAPATDALDALKLLDAKVKVDKSLADAPKDDPARPQAETAMRLYVMAMQTWAMKIQRKGT